MVRRSLRAAGVLVAAFAFLIGSASLASASADNVVIALNETDGSYVAKQKLKIVRTTSSTVDQGNVAWAEATCEACTTIAVAVHVVLATGDPNVMAPKNLAVAYNNGCTSCATLAEAHQFVVTSNGPLRFTETGSERIEDIRDDMDDLFDGEPGIEQVSQEVALLVAELEDVLRNELVRVATRSIHHRSDEDREG